MKVRFLKRLSGFKLAAAVLLPLLFLYTSVPAQSNFRILESIPDEIVIERVSTEPTADVWTECIRNAKNSVDIETFYIAGKDGSLLKDFLEELKKAAGRGVKVRIIVDSSFYASNDKSVDLLEGINNIEIRKIPFRNLSGGVMHAKYFIVDAEKLFLGSQNMDWRALQHIHEVGALITDKSLASAFGNIFETDWQLCEGNNYGLSSMKLNSFPNAVNPLILTDYKYGTIELYPAVSPYGLTVSGFEHELDELLKLINGAKERLDIQAYSYSTKTSGAEKFEVLDSALRSAAKRGVKIRMLFPDWATKPGAINDIKALSAVENIQIRIISLPLHSSGFIPYARVDHSKYFVCDNDISWLSTTNWEKNYFYNSRNISLIIRNEGINGDLSKIFDSWWGSLYAEPVDISREYPEVRRK